MEYNIGITSKCTQQNGYFNRVLILLYIDHLYHKHVRRNAPRGMVNTVAL